MAQHVRRHTCACVVFYLPGTCPRNKQAARQDAQPTSGNQLTPELPSRLPSPAEEHGLEDIQTRDWSEEVSPFWGAVIATALTSQGLAGLLKAGWTTIKVRRGCRSAEQRRSTFAESG